MGRAQPTIIMGTKIARDLSWRDLKAALAAGLADFRACPMFGLFFAGFYVAAGLFLYSALVEKGEAAWLVPAAAGFPLLAPFIAVGLYEVSRRREAGLPIRWRAVLGALRGHDDDQLLMMGGFIFVGFTFWIIMAHGIFAIFLSASGEGSESLAFLASAAGIQMLLVGGAVGAVMALIFYAVTLVSLPMLVDREVDFLTAMIVSLAVTRANFGVLMLWGALMAGLLFLAMASFFMGLLIVLPVLAHASWHLYKRLVL